MDDRSIIFITLLTVASSLFYLYRRFRLRVLEAAGVTVVGKPNFLFGNLLDFRGFTFRQRLQAWTKVYGKTYGYYEGPTPVIVSSDLDFLQGVMVKQFAAFNARKIYALQEDPTAVENIHMFLAEKDRWKRLRSSASPAFSTAKIRSMFATVFSCSDRLLKNVTNASSCGDEGFEIYELYQRFTLDVIFECAFGVHVNAQENPTSVYLTKIRDAFNNMQIPFFIIPAMVFWEIRSVFRHTYGALLKIGAAHNPFFYIFEHLIPNIVKLRQKEAESRINGEKDLIQIMLDAQQSQATDRSLADNISDGPNKADQSSRIKSGVELSQKEVESQIQLFMLAGYETSSTALAYCTYLLSTHPDVQKRLQREIDDFYSSEVEVDAEADAQVEAGAETQTQSEIETGSASESDRDKEGKAVTYERLIGSKKLEYLDMVILETLRLYPIASNALHRRCIEDTEVRGIKIPAGFIVMPDVWSVHNDSEIWGPVDPQAFYPERFLPEVHASRHPLSFLAFGSGPRNCIGMRFALLEIKLALVRLLRLFDILECARTEKPLALREMEVISPKNGVFVRLQERHERSK